jgi:hypothetical protein
MKQDVNFELMVFDHMLWGHKDEGDNSKFWKKARAVKMYRDEHDDLLVDVIFEHDGRLSCGHFYYWGCRRIA